jgi:hypothetical protein
VSEVLRRRAERQILRVGPARTQLRGPRSLRHPQSADGTRDPAGTAVIGRLVAAPTVGG